MSVWGCCANELGWQVGAPRLPLAEADEAELEVVRGALVETGLLP